MWHRVIVFCVAFACVQETFARQGFHYGIGIGGFGGHRAIQSLSVGPSAIRLYPSLSASVGLAFDVEINKSFSFAPELQCALYKTQGQLALTNGTDFSDLKIAGVEMRSLELPMLARFSFGSVYAEAGPQVGANILAKIYVNSELKRPSVNILAFGPTIGAGMHIKNVLIGLRGHLGLIEYAKKTDGYPWAAQMLVNIYY